MSQLIDNSTTICFHCLSLFPVEEAINRGVVKLIPAGKSCHYCEYLDEHRSPFRNEIIMGWQPCVTEK